MQELTLDLSFAGDAIDCGDVQHPSNPFLPDVPDFERDVVNFNLGDGFDVVINFGAGSIVIGPPIEPGLPPQLFDPVNDVLRIENVGVLTTEVVFSDQGHGTLVQNGAGSVFLVGVTTPLTQSVDGNYLLLFDAA
jgi:hypothetical protein